MELVATLLLFLVSAALPAQNVPHATGIVHTAAVDLGYEPFGARQAAALPVIALNGGPGLSYA